MVDKTPDDEMPRERKSIYNFSEVLGSGVVKPLPLTYVIRDLLIAKPEVWEKAEKYLLPPGVEGSRQFDHAYVVVTLREHSNGKLDGFNGRMIFDCFIRAIRAAGFKVQHGRVTGLLEKKPAEETPLEPGEPDVE